MDYTNVNGVSNGSVHHAYGYFAAVLPPYVLLSEIVAKAECPISLIDIFLKNQLDDFRILRHDYKVTHILIFLIHAACPLCAVAKRRPSAGVMTLLGQLLNTGLDAQGSFDALPGCLPIAYLGPVHINQIRGFLSKF